MSSQSLSRAQNKIQELMNYDRNELYLHPESSFDFPPPNYEETTDPGWRILAKSIVSSSSGGDTGLK